ncbi:MAG: enoyl-CoA hydratase/isomerase family protein [Desulfatitalea sp.]|nr:enoyl-CoA hydratase/isomerase family protein [Desulfatitalea sp.]NNK01760.1 enoyl-CoA hydratase/isomerase family protein [Desulfatitalea sp.]
MALFELDRDETVAIIKMTGGKNTQNTDFMVSFSEMLDKAIGDESVTAIVLTATDEKSWSQGLDLDWLAKCISQKRFEEIEAFMIGMDRIFTTLLTCPVPVIASITGHSFANGAVLASYCDFRFMRTDRGFFCFPEVDIDIQFTPGMVALFRHKYPGPFVNEMLLTGKRVTAPELEKLKVINKACTDSEETLKESIAFAKTQVKNRATLAEMKRKLNLPVLNVMENDNPGYFKVQFKG